MTDLFRKKPIAVEARQVPPSEDGASGLELAAWRGGSVSGTFAETYERADEAAPPADGQAYSGELAMLRTVVREVRSAAFVHEDLAAVRRLLTEHAVNHVDARNTAGERPDTFPAWLARRFDRNGAPWDGMSEGDRSYWEHEAAAVRRALARRGFKTDTTQGDNK